MRISTTRTLRIVAGGLALVAVGTVSCNDTPTAPQSVETGLAAPGGARFTVTSTRPAVVISQLYGGGGNGGSTLKNDFIELFNPGTEAVSLAGWSVQYSSASGTAAWLVTNLSGSIPAGGYYLVQEAQGTGGTVGLPAPDASGTIAMSGTDGRVALVNTITPLAATTPSTCPTAVAAVIDVVGYGTTSCGTPLTTDAPVLSATAAALRNDGGCAWTGNPKADFASPATAPAPRNSQSPAHSCSGGGTQIGPLHHITITGPTDAIAGGTAQFTATGYDLNGTALSPQPTIAWSTSDAAILDVNATTGAASAAAVGQATITATSGTIAATIVVTVSAPPEVRGKVVISQLYGGGGNAGATYKNDFIELFNPGTEAVSLAGWSLQYNSANGTGAWQVTTLTGTIPAGGYYLVQQTAGTGGTANLPTPELIGAINMSGTDGRVALLGTTTPLPAASPAACPSSAPALADLVAFGTTACGSPSTTFDTPTLSSTLAAVRLSGGCLFSGVPKADFTTAAPNPRNGATASRSCVVGPLTQVVVAGPTSVGSGFTAQLTASAQDANGNIVKNATITWESSDPTVATVDATGLVTGLGAATASVTMTATAVSNGITKTGSQSVTVTAPGIGFIGLTSSSSSFPPGFQTQLFPTARASQGGIAIPATFVFEALDPAIATVANVANTGIVTAVAPPADGITKPRFKITATALSGAGQPYSFTATPITVEAPVSAPLTTYGTNDEFGDPTPASASNPNDFLIVRPQYTLSYNQSRGTPNWVSYELDLRQLATGQDRCNCFTADPALPADKQILTSDYTNGGYDRGHMAPSADRIVANVDNANTFYLTNIVPQQGDLNQGVWANFESALRDSVRAGRAVYIITGPLYSRSKALSFVKNEGKVAIPDSTWKVAIIGPGNNGVPFTHERLQTLADTQGISVVAVNMPNVAGVRNNPWSMYLTTVDKIEAATGLDFLSVLPADLQAVIESNDHPPVAALVPTASGNEGAAIAFDASATGDPDVGDVLTYVWSFGDGQSATTADPRPTHAYAQDGTYTVNLTVRDAAGLTSTATATATIANVAPTATFDVPATAIVEGSSFTLTLAGVVEPGTADKLTYQFNCGTVWVTSATPSISCPTTDNGAPLSVHARISDDGGGVNSYDGIVSTVNAAPTAAIVAPASVVEGSAIEFNLANATDPSSVDQASLTFAYACSATESWHTLTAASFSCPTTDNGSVTVRGKVTDKDGGFTEYSQVVTITNAAPVIARFTAPAGPSSTGATVTASLAYSDVGTADTHSAIFAWGDGTTSTVNGAAGQVAGTHSYAAAGFYTISVTLSDDDGGSATTAANSVLAVYDASAGGVKAEGWLPAAGLLTVANGRDDDERDGGRNKKQFSLEAEYGRGAVPRGDFTFVSASDRIAVRGRALDYLVVKGQSATVRGTGVLANGTAVGFLFYAVDGKLAGNRGDLVRIKIWSLATGAVLFDSEPGVGDLASQGTALGGGNVKLSRSEHDDDGQRGNNDDRGGDR